MTRGAVLRHPRPKEAKQMGSRDDRERADGAALDRRQFLARTVAASAAVTGLGAWAPGAWAHSAAGKTIGISLPFRGSPVYNALLNGMKVAAKMRGCTFLQSQSANDASAQLNELNTWLARPVDAILLFPLSPSALGPIVKKAHGQGTKVVGYAAKVPGEDGFNIFDHAQGARLVGQAAAKYAKAHFGGQAKVALIAADSEPVGHTRVNTAWLELKKQLPGAQLLARPQVPQAFQAQAYKAMQSVLQAHPDVNMVICVDDDESIGVAQAFKNAHREPSTWWVAGFDGSLAALQKIYSGEIRGVTAALPLKKIGADSINIPMNLIEGKTPTSVNQKYVLVDNTTKALAKKLIGDFKH
jgi:ABC-type sugar transport system substrate-binding protein